MKLRVLAIVPFVVCAPLAVVMLTHCELQGSCDGSTYVYNDYFAQPAPFVVNMPLPPGAGMIDETHWQSGPIDGDWLDYPGERLIFLYPNLVASADGGPPALRGNFPGPYTNVSVFISPNQNANAPGSNWTSAGGNPGEISVQAPADGGDPENWNVAVTNATCAHYYVRVVVERAAPDAGPDDAGTDAGTVTDASSSALSDAPSEATFD